MKRYLFSFGIGLAGFVAGFAVCYVCCVRSAASIPTLIYTTQQSTLDQPQWRAYVVQPTYPPKFQGEM